MIILKRNRDILLFYLYHTHKLFKIRKEIIDTDISLQFI